MKVKDFLEVFYYSDCKDIYVNDKLYETKVDLMDCEDILTNAEVSDDGTLYLDTIKR